jgi:hypothetical protein
VSDLERLAWAAWHFDIQATKPTQRSTARVPADLSDAAIEHRKDLLNLLEFGLRGDERVQAELTAIRAGGGYVDLLRDLVRLADLATKHGPRLAARLPQDYSPSMADEALRLADELRQALGLVPDNTQDDTSARFWNLFWTTFYEVKAALTFLFRRDPTRLGALPSLSAPRKSSRARSTSRPTPDDPRPTPANA